MEIKVWVEKENKMYGPIDLYEHLANPAGRFESGSFEILPYTGKVDKNGVKIFKGDDVSFECCRPDLTMGRVEWSKEGAYWYIKSRLPLLLHNAENIEVINDTRETD